MVETKEMKTEEIPKQDKPILPPPTRNVISLDQIINNRLSHKGLYLYGELLLELMELPLFKDKPYHIGTPSNRLFLRNLHKNVKKSDLEFIFGRYFENDEAAK